MSELDNLRGRYCANLEANLISICGLPSLENIGRKQYLRNHDSYLPENFSYLHTLLAYLLCLSLFCQHCTF